jgi:hypothetical protein
MAKDTLFIVAACLLKVYNISPSKDMTGGEIPVTGSYSATGAILWFIVSSTSRPGLIGLKHSREPDPFKCSFTIRSASANYLFSEHADL